MDYFKTICGHDDAGCVPGEPCRARVTVTWTGPGLAVMTNPVDLSHGRRQGLTDEETCRRVLAIRHLRAGLAEAHLIDVLSIEPVTK